MSGGVTRWMPGKIPKESAKEAFLNSLKKTRDTSWGTLKAISRKIA